MIHTVQMAATQGGLRTVSISYDDADIDAGYVQKGSEFNPVGGAKVTQVIVQNNSPDQWAVNYQGNKATIPANTTRTFNTSPSPQQRLNFGDLTLAKGGL